MKQILLIGFLFFSFFSCKKDEIKYLELERGEYLKNGEWIGEKDSTSGLSTRKNMVGFFKHMALNGDEIHHYTIVDSIKAINSKKDTLKTFLKWISLTNDTIYLELVEYDTISLKIKDVDQKIKTYTYFTDSKRKIQDSIRENRLELHPSFKDSVCNQTQETCFKYDFNKYLNDNFDSSIINNFPNATKSINVEFILTKNGEISDIKTNSKNQLLKSEINKLLNSLPEINSGTYNSKNVKIKYSLTFKYSKKGNNKSGMSSYSFEHIYLEKIEYK